MSDPHKLETLDHVIRWAIEHDARIDVYWENQHKWNDSADAKMSSLGRRLTSLEKRVMWLTGAAAAVGGAAGTVLNSILMQ